jgi:hypothetical protein
LALRGLIHTKQKTKGSVLAMYSKEVFNQQGMSLVVSISEILTDGLSFIGKYEKLANNEGQVKIIIGQNKVGFEVYAPHLIPNQLSCSWLADSFEEAYENCKKDLLFWIEIEKRCTKRQIWS